MLLVLKREGSEWIVCLWECIMKPPNALVPEIGDMILPHNQFDIEKRLISPLFTTQKTFMSMQILSDSLVCAHPAFKN